MEAAGPLARCRVWIYATPRRLEVEWMVSESVDRSEFDRRRSLAPFGSGTIDENAVKAMHRPDVRTFPL